MTNKNTNSIWNNVSIYAFVIGISSLLYTFIFGKEESAFYYLTAYLFWLSISLGALFFVLFQFLTRATWNAFVQRIAENIMMILPVFAILFIPIFLNMNTLFSWTTPELFAENLELTHLLERKSSYLNVPFFLLRSMLYFVIWTGISWLFYSKSVSQEGARFLQKFAAPALVLTVLSVTFAIFDWNMSLDWQWFSTIFGVYFFSGAMVAFFAFYLLVILFLTLKQTQFSKKMAEKLDIFHDIAKLLWGFTLFWSYIAFSQFLIVWYANVPEETLWFAHRWKGNWQIIGWTLAIAHFGIPLFLFMSRHVKRNIKMLWFFALYMLLFHALDLIWQVLPIVQQDNFYFDLTLISAFLGIGAIFLGTMSVIMKQSSLDPIVISKGCNSLDKAK